MRKIGILTSGGDCAGLNPAIYALAKSLYSRLDNVEIIGIYDGFTGLIDLNTKVLGPDDFDGLLDQGGTFLRSIRQGFKTMEIPDEKGVTKADKIVKNYKKLGLDALAVLGGNGSHKVAKLLSQRGLNVVALPKTIDNDIFGTDETFGYDTAIQTGVNYIAHLKTTAASHSRVFVVEIMGNKVGWLALSTGVAAGADVVILPEIPYDIDKVNKAVTKALRHRNYAFVVVSEGAYSKNEPQKNKERAFTRESTGFHGIGEQLAKEIEAGTGRETRSAVPGHELRGGTPSAFDRLYTMQLGNYAAKLIQEEKYGLTVARVKGKITANKLEDVAGISKPVPLDDRLIKAARNTGISFGD
ncbi:MAG: 6-phosphofructokinase [Streptococcaceae bacterium]|jgi:6-phosphofructokinase 1|nr:6-phosphofructokinase [Streptococcaceae bacterium]